MQQVGEKPTIYDATDDQLIEFGRRLRRSGATIKRSVFLKYSRSLALQLRKNFTVEDDFIGSQFVYLIERRFKSFTGYLNKISKPFEYTPENIGIVFRGMDAYEIRMTEDAVGASEAAFQKVLKAKFPEARMPGLSTFIEKARSTFGTFPDAVRAANLTASDKVQWSPELFKQALQSAIVAGIDLSAGDIAKGTNDESLALLRPKLLKPGLTIKGGSLYQYGVDTYGSWDKALAIADLNPKEIRVNTEWTDQKIKKILKLSQKNGFPVNPEFFAKGASDEWTVLIEKELGEFIYPQNFLAATYRHFSGWEEALKKSKIDAVKGLKYFRWNKNKIFKLFSAMEARKIPLSVASFKGPNAKPEEISSLCEQLFHRRLTAASIEGGIVRKFERFSAAFEAYRESVKQPSQSVVDPNEKGPIKIGP